MKKEKEGSPEEFIISEEAEWHKSPMIVSPDFPRAVTYKLMEDYANYKVNLKMQEIQLISGN